MEGRHIYTFVKIFPEARKNRSYSILFSLFVEKDSQKDAMEGLHP